VFLPRIAPLLVVIAIPAGFLMEAVPHPQQDRDGLLRINRTRLEQTLMTLGQIGRDPVTGGIERTAFSAADLEARRWLAARLEEAGMEVRLDAAANLIGRRPGTDPQRGALVLGSHLDSVPQGGRYDGAAGLVSALEVVRTLNDLNIRTRHPIEIVNFSDEEGGLVGSRAWIGAVTDHDLERTYQGRTLRQVLTELGLDPEGIDRARRAPAEVTAYLELHVEQGRTLELEGWRLGVVEGIVALDQYEITVTGQANHAGTTRMRERRDSMTAAARMIVDLREEVLRQGGPLVGTVGRLEAEPGASNVIPAQVRFTLDLRDPSRMVVDQTVRTLQQRFEQIARQENVTADWRTIVTLPPAPADPDMMDILREAAARYGYPHGVLPSGAGHDAQSVARLAPMGMIFVPSIGGVSHAPGEYTPLEDLAAGADVLLQSVLLLDGRNP
jgi:beta-ureidopropionase / N-carbamoyl-L-amino-acid hydrolase